MNNWTFLNEFVRISSQWVTLVGERWLSDEGYNLEYWRVEKNDSVIVLPIQANQIFCVKPTFRVGINRCTLDFPGGRLPTDKEPKEIVGSLLEQELGVQSGAILSTTALNKTKWIINSSFSNQGLWGFVVELDETVPIPNVYIGASAQNNDRGIAELLAQLDCLQCRTVLLQWQHQKGDHF